LGAFKKTMDVRIGIAFDSGLLDALQKSGNVAKRVRTRKILKEVQVLLTTLGYTEHGAIWVSSPGRESSLISTLSYQLMTVVGLRENCKAITAVRLSEDPLDLLENIGTMMEPRELKSSSQKIKFRP
jgi:hypothetical protein